MWNSLVRIILRYRTLNLIIIGIITAFMGYKALNVQMSYEMAKMLPSSDSIYIKYEKFKKTFGEDGNVVFVGMQSKKLQEINPFNKFYDLNFQLKEIDGVKEVVSLARLFYLQKNKLKRKFEFNPIFLSKPTTQKELDSLLKKVYSQPLYNELLYNKETGANMIMITLDKGKLNSPKRIELISKIKNEFENFGKQYNIKFHYSGLPYIRTVTTEKVKKELKYFVLLAMLIAAFILFLFYRSFKAVFFPLIIVSISLIWVMGTIVLLNYKITILTGIIPPLLIVIVVENCIFLLNKYHNEYRIHGNKIKALSRVVQRIGNATFLTNATTAIGFATFIITFNEILVEFGIIASISIMMGYLLSLFLIPIIFSYLKVPKKRHTKHLDNKKVGYFMRNIVYSTLYRRKLNFSIFFILLIIGAFGASKLTTTGNIVDDIPKKDPLYKDLMFFEKHVKGIMPFEVVVDTKKKNGVLRLSTLKKIDKFQKKLAEYSEFSKPLSIVEVVKSATQAYYNGNPAYYKIPNNQEKNFIFSYVPRNKKTTNKKTILDSFVDTTMQKTRISVQMQNIGTKQIQKIKDDLKPKIDSIFSPKKYNISITGTSIVFLKGSGFLIKNLKTSLVFAILLISLLMALLFSSFRMVIIILITNLFPLIVTAGMMGYMKVPLKPSTVIIFSIAFGISVNNAIHFLAKYRQELKKRSWNIKESCVYALQETSISMMYSSVVLFFGFAIFTLSSFGGTQALGLLVSFTLLVAFFANIIILPSLLLALKNLTAKAFKNPIFKGIAVYNEKIENKESRFLLRKKKYFNQLNRRTNKKNKS